MGVHQSCPSLAAAWTETFASFAPLHWLRRVKGGVRRRPAPMNIDQQNNVDEMVRALAEALVAVWSYLHLLRGFQRGGQSQPLVLERFGRLFDQTWRAIFDALFAKAGTLIDRRKGTYSLPNLLKSIRRCGNPELKDALAYVETRLNDSTGPMVKLKNWRHQVVAHRTKEGRDDDFYQSNKMHLEDVESAVIELEQLLNRLSVGVLAIHNDTRSGSLGLVDQGASLFASIAAEPRVPGASSQAARSELER